MPICVIWPFSSVRLLMCIHLQPFLATSISTLSDGTVVLSKNATYIQRPVSKDKLPFPRADGLWGPHDTSLLPRFSTQIYHH